MSSIPKKVGAITLFVADPVRSKSFYQRILEADVLFEDRDAATLKLDNVVLNMLRVSEADELIVPATVGQPGSGSVSMLTIWVDDADAACAQLGAAGVALLNGPIDRPWGVRTAAFADLDGHVWELAQQIKA